MDPTARLRDVAADLDGLSNDLFAIHRDGTGRAAEQQTRELARRVAYWSIALGRVAESGLKVEGAFAARIAAGSSGAESDAGPDPNFVAELDVLTVITIGDIVLDGLAYAELVRRDKMRSWQPGERVPDLWPKFMGLLDASPDDPMTDLARQLDLTLAYARDVLVAHPDPTLLSLPIFTSSGVVRLHRGAVDEQRRAAGFDELKQVNAVFERPGPETDYRQMLNLVVVRAGKLDKPARDRMKRAYRLAGFDSPPLPKMVGKAIRLVRLHLDALREQKGSAGL